MRWPLSLCVTIKEPVIAHRRRGGGARPRAEMRSVGDYRLVDEDKPPTDIKHGREQLWVTGAQIFGSILLAGCGMVGASLLLDRVQYWEVFVNVSELYILLPALLGLKGNLEMTLTSRLSTHANLGHLGAHLKSLVVGNLCLVQCQAVLVGLLAAVAAMPLGWIPDGEFSMRHAILLCASSVLTASLASFILGFFMVGVIVVSTKVGVNPDNVATPIAANLSDLTTLTLLSFTATFLYKSTESSVILACVVIACSVAIIPICGYVAWKNEFTRQALDESWLPVVAAMVISSAGGLILDYTVSRYKGIAMFQLVVNGIGGNMVAVNASKLSTRYHAGQQPASVLGDTSKLLLAMVIPSHLIFVYTIATIQADHIPLTPTFMLTYLSAAFLHVTILLLISHHAVVWMWRAGLDPDNSAIPYLTALGDLLGMTFLGLAFRILNATQQ